MKHISAWIDTPLGPMSAVAVEAGVCRLEFAESPIEDRSRDLPEPFRTLAEELEAYFEGRLKVFKTPLFFEKGTSFQRKVWAELAKIPYGETRSYKELALAVGNPTACRAVAQANGANPLTLLIPCHRVINTGGALGGYGGGIFRKKRLLKHERLFA